MKKFLFALLPCLLASCVTVSHNVAMNDLARPARDFVDDRTKPDDYPGFAAGEGNIYSCRYGIHHQSSAEFQPPKKEIFAALIAKSVPEIAAHRVSLQRFDVYFNHRLATLNKAGNAIGGGVGAAIAAVGNVNKDVFTFDKLIVDRNPGAVRHEGENQVGCDRAQEGEYYASEVSGGHSVIVTWMKFEVDGHPFLYRTYYQFQPGQGIALEDAIRDAMAKSVAAIAPEVRQSLAGVPPQGG